MNKPPQELVNSEPLPQTFAGMKRRYDRDMAIRQRKEDCYAACHGLPNPAEAMRMAREALERVQWGDSGFCPDCDHEETDDQGHSEGCHIMKALTALAPITTKQEGE